MKQITSDVYLMKMAQTDSRAPQVNVYFLKNEKLLIDAGPDNYPCYLELQQNLKSLMTLTLFRYYNPPPSRSCRIEKYFPEETAVYADPGVRYNGTTAYLNAIEEQTQQKSWAFRRMPLIR